jgi:hypothetical protein
LNEFDLTLRVLTGTFGPQPLPVMYYPAEMHRNVPLAIYSLEGLVLFLAAIIISE